MSSDILRRAAALMRGRAEAATPSPWRLNADERCVRHPWDDSPDSGWILWDDSMEHSEDLSDGEHIASWHPAVGLAVADWLDATADTRDDPYYRENYDDLMRPAIAVARAYLNEPA